MSARCILRALATAGWLMLGSAAAEPVIPRSELPGLGAGATRQRVDETTAPWQSLGRVQTELGQRCTGTLIAPDRVLTAAHCLTAPRRDQLVQPGSVHFLLGYTAGQFRAHRRVVAFQTSKGYRPADKGPVGADWAVLQLEAPLDVPSLPLRLARPGDRIMLGGYQQDRAEVIMADTDCRVLSLQQQAGATVLLHGCAGTRGASGAPLLRREPKDGWAIVGVAVAAARQQAGGLAVSAQAIQP